MRQLAFGEIVRRPPQKQFLKWIGNKQRFAEEIAGYAPDECGKFIEPFIGSGAVLATMAPTLGLASDNLKPLVEMWRLLQADPGALLKHYAKLWHEYQDDSNDTYYRALASYNENPNPYDLLFLCRSCYGGVVRFRKDDGGMSTPIGIHRPISPESLDERMREWRARIRNTKFMHCNFDETMAQAGDGDVVYCDPPYVFSQQILYGSQDFSLPKLWAAISRAKKAGAKVMLSIDGKKKSGKVELDLGTPDDLFEREIMIGVGRSMLRRFQRKGETLEDEEVHDRLLLTW